MENLEVWMRGPVPEVPDLLQPVAHVLLQILEDLDRQLTAEDDTLLWVKPFGMASVGFHLLHMRGVIDRMFTYAREESLTENQFEYLEQETMKHEELGVDDLLEALSYQVEQAIAQLKHSSAAALTATRYLGRKRIPTTLIGLLFHAAEHAQRHYGQLLVTIHCVRALQQQRSIH